MHRALLLGLITLTTSAALHGQWRGTSSLRPQRAHAAAAPAILMRSTMSDDELLESLRARVDAGDGADLPTERVRLASIRPDGLEGAGLRFSEASLASTTGPVFSVDDLPEGYVLKPAQAIKGLYAAFNARDAVCVASFLTDECVYEDLLLGPATVCRGKEAFLGALRFHPAFVSSRLLGGLPFAEYLPDLTIEVDSIAEGSDTVGVEWHVQCGDTPFPLGRGLTQAKVNLESGKIERVVDIAEAPWRVIGLISLPFITFVQSLSQRLSRGRGGWGGSADGTGANAAGGGENPAEAAAAAAMDAVTAAVTGLPPPAAINSGSGGGSAPKSATEVAAEAAEVAERQYELMLGAVLVDGHVDPSERTMLAEYADANQLSRETHVRLLERAGWTEGDYVAGRQLGKAAGVAAEEDAAADATIE